MSGFVMIGGGGEACTPEDGCLPGEEVASAPEVLTLEDRVSKVTELPLGEQVTEFEQLSEELVQRLQSTRG